MVRCDPSFVWFGSPRLDAKFATEAYSPKMFYRELTERSKLRLYFSTIC